MPGFTEEARAGDAGPADPAVAGITGRHHGDHHSVNELRRVAVAGMGRRRFGAGLGDAQEAKNPSVCFPTGDLSDTKTPPCHPLPSM